MFRFLLLENFFTLQPIETHAHSMAFCYKYTIVLRLVYLYLYFLIKTVFHHKRKQFDNHMEYIEEPIPFQWRFA